MKKLLSVLIVAIILCGFAACGEGDSLQTTTNTGGNQAGTTTTTQTDDDNFTTSHNHSHTTTQGVDGSGDESNTDETTSNDGAQGDSDVVTTTLQGQQVTTNQVITTTTKKGETTKKTEINTTTTKKTTTTTTKKTSTTTKKITTTLNSNTVKNHSFTKATYTKLDINKHTATGKCSVCGLSATQTEWHNWGVWKYDVQPTATKDGVKYRVCTGCGEEQVTVAPATSVNTSNYAQEVFELVNAERAKYGLPAFKYYTAGQSGANTRAKELMTFFSHTRPDGSKWWTVASFDKSVCQSGAENIARGYGDPEDVVAAFMASGDHRTNILSTKYTHIVVGYYEGAWVQIFIKPW